MISLSSPLFRDFQLSNANSCNSSCCFCFKRPLREDDLIYIKMDRRVVRLKNARNPSHEHLFQTHFRLKKYLVSQLEPLTHDVYALIGQIEKTTEISLTGKEPMDLGALKRIDSALAEILKTLRDSPKTPNTPPSSPIDQE